ncbi:hypothetical protein P3X46_005607 [Hevea brasiliensis]|uniref:Uncharacterized protein n=1 Tax=Hevea brasiliensis TaxID=3981 RepID=A0ABQ9N0H5_HEVBR|nr:hypothetical protein P3X46_005607 [Hevea brasiliensis]
MKLSTAQNHIRYHSAINADQNSGVRCLEVVQYKMDNRWYDDELERNGQYKSQQDKEQLSKRVDAHKQQQQRQKQVEESGSGQVSNPLRNATALADHDQWKALKFGFSSKSGTSKKPTGGAAKKPKVAIAPVFSNDSDEEQ